MATTQRLAKTQENCSKTIMLDDASLTRKNWTFEDPVITEQQWVSEPPDSTCAPCVFLPSSLFPSAAAELTLGWTELVPVPQMPWPPGWMSIPLGREERERGKGAGRVLRDASTESRGREERLSTTDHALLNRKHSAWMYTSKCCTSSVRASPAHAEWGDLVVTSEREWWHPVSGEVRHVSTDFKKACAHIHNTSTTVWCWIELVCFWLGVWLLFCSLITIQ